ncbi:MAG: HAMP domain-containing sensor histidine kinase [Candidatus Daviesbacteria bacterium]|nr:HAMP domain-containing sensor histidine kinase [Candidatus Daviesbacteria bacterium]
MQSLPVITIFSSLVFFILGCFIGKQFLTKIIKKTEKAEINPDKQNLQKQKEILEKVLEVIKEGTIITNQNDFILWTNRKALEILKTSWTLTQNKTIDQIMPKNETADAQNYQVKLTTIDQEEIDVSVKKYPLLNSQGNIYIINDITDRMALEESKLNFVAIAAHQLRTPLTAIKGYLFILKEKIAPKLNEEEKSFLDRTIIGTDRMGFLIENLLNLSKVEKGCLKLNIKPIDLENLIRQTVDGLLADAKEKKVNLLIGKFAKPYPMILGDENLLIESLSNIVANGIKYSKPGGQVNLDIEKQANGISIHVSDKGKGIPATVIPRLFQKFYGATNSLTELSSGLGLGLFISKSIIDAHNGKIMVNSLENMGTTVSIFLPSNQD